MTKASYVRAIVLIVLTVLFAGCEKKQSEMPLHPFSPELESELRTFFALKEAQARELQSRDQKEFAKPDAKFTFAKGGFPPAAWKFFTAGKKGDWSSMSEIFSKRIAPRSHQFEHPGDPDEHYATTAWQPLNEAHFAYQQLAVANPKHLLNFGQQICDSLPTNSVYFAGTDAGRFVVDFSSLAKGRPRFFTLISQNQLADGLYREHLQAVGPKEFQLPTDEEATQSFTDYLADAGQRLEANQLKPGEFVQKTNGRVQVSGIIPVMEINARLAKVIFKNNPSREFFIDNQIPFDWAYSHFEPYGFVLKINREPLPELSAEVLRKDFEFWKLQTSQTIGNWLETNTPITEVCAWIENTFLHNNLNGFTGDVDFINTANNVRSPSDIYGASAVYSKSRANIADVYAWRALNAKTEPERQRMVAATDFAFRQALALGPAQTDAGRGYFSFLWWQARREEALQVVKTIAKFRTGDQSYQQFVSEVESSIEQVKK